MAKITITDWSYSQEEQNFNDYGVRINIDGKTIDEYCQIHSAADAFDLLSKIFEVLDQDHEIILNEDHVFVEDDSNEGC